MRGRRPIPAVLRILRGNPGRRHIHGEPIPEMGPLQQPVGLNKEARKIWDDLAPELYRLKLLTKIDQHHLMRICRLEALGMKLLRKTEKMPVVDTKANGLQPSGEMSAALRAFESADRWWTRFGISPGERSRINLPAVKPKTSLSRFIDRDRKLRGSRNVAI